MTARGAVIVIPRDLFGIPMLAFAVHAATCHSVPIDSLFAPLIARAAGDIAALGPGAPLYRPVQQLGRDRRVLLLDIGNVRHVRDGDIAIFPGIAGFNDTGVVFEDGPDLAAGTVLMATGSRPALHHFLSAVAPLTTTRGAPLLSG